MENNITPNFVPSGITPFGPLQADSTPAIRTACILFDRKADTQLVRAGCILSFYISILWSMRSNPLTMKLFTNTEITEKAVIKIRLTLH